MLVANETLAVLLNFDVVQLSAPTGAHTQLLYTGVRTPFTAGV
jgi:hypothetical protein